MKEIDRYTAARKRQSLRRRFEAKTLLIELKQNNPCVDCGRRFHYCQMDFIQKDGSSSLRINNLLNRSVKRILEEVSKRDLVCANCSRMRIWKKQRSERSGLV
jgi:hypothetical protein